jgi:cell division protein FtsB
MPPSETRALVEQYVEQNKTLQRVSWGLTLVALAVFAVFSILGAQKARQYIQLTQEADQLRSQIKELKQAKNNLESQNKTQQAAIDLVKQQTPGERPKVMIYRESIAPQVEAALSQLGYPPPEQKLESGNSTLASKPVDTLEYGCAIANEDIRTIAAALSQSGLPIRRIAPAQRNLDPHLVQLIASRSTNSNSPAMTVEQIKNWNRPDKTCQ